MEPTRALTVHFTGGSNAVRFSVDGELMMDVALPEHVIRDATVTRGAL